MFFQNSVRITYYRILEVIVFKSIFSIFAFALLLNCNEAFAEGSLQLPNQSLNNTTVVFEITDFTVETFVWTGIGSVLITPPTGPAMMLASGQVYTPAENGDFSLAIISNQPLFDFSVKDGNGNEIPGRVSSKLWRLSQGASVLSNLNGSFFAAIPSGASEIAVIELKLEGFNGIGYSIAGNGTGVVGPNSGRSVVQAGHTSVPEYRMYLNPPDVASYSAFIPNASNFGFNPTGATQSCDLMQVGISTGDFTFTSNAEGTYHLICDLNNDGDFSLNGAGNDLFLSGATTVGLNTVFWDGTSTGNNGAPVPAGNYNCKLEVVTGEFHFAVGDAEYSFPGFRLFEVSRTGQRTGLPMHWNDGLLIPRGSDSMMDDLSNSADFSPTGGLLPGNYTDVAIPFSLENPNGTARAWGHSTLGIVANGTAQTKGNAAYLDSFTWIEESASLNVSFAAVDPTLDSDMDGLTNYEEACLTGTHPMDADTDGDGVLDGAEVRANGGSPLSPSNTDGDTVIDALEICADGHLSTPLVELCDDGNGTNGDGCSANCAIESGYSCLIPGQACVDIDECLEGTHNCDMVAMCTNTTGAFTCACPIGFNDVNANGTLCEDIDECANGNSKCDVNAACSNTPGTYTCSCNFGYNGNGAMCTPVDSDKDGILDIVECTTPNLGCDDFDDDGVPNYLDADSDNDGILDSLECPQQPCRNTDANGSADYIDVDADDDGITDTFEAGYADVDGDGEPDGFVDLDGDGVSDIAPLQPTDTNDNGTPDYRSLDSDGDTIPDSNEGHDSDGNGSANQTPTGNDTDGDGLDDAFDPDCMNASDCAATIGVKAPKPDTDQDGHPNFQDLDSDDDGMTDFAECGLMALCLDNDLDGTPNYLDLDSDNDTVSDVIEGHDMNGDGVADVNFGAQDSNNNGLDDAFDPDCVTVADCNGIIGTSPQTVDHDRDGKPDRTDKDDDGDGILTSREVADGMLFGDDPDNDGIPAYLDTNSDGDGTDDVAEGTNDPATGMFWDLDNDGTPDYLDPDSSPVDTDRDGIPDTIECEGDIENCVDSDRDGDLDFLDIDDDNDGILTREETREGSANDIDLDGTPNHLDSDSDGDGVDDQIEGHNDILVLSGNDTDMDGLDDAFDEDDGGIRAGTPDSDRDGSPNYLDVDDDADGIATIDEELDADDNPGNDDQDGDGIPNYLDIDSDADGLTDDQECNTELCKDSDGDDVPDYLDSDSDNDGILDVIEGHLTAGPRPSKMDSDGDGLDDAFDTNSDQPAAIDTDSDGTPDYLDWDSDDDSVDDFIEGHDDALSLSGNDSDNDGVDDAFDADNGGIPGSTPDSDSDGEPDYRDIDDDNDGILTIDEQTDEDSDGIPDYLDDEDSTPETLALGGGSCSSIHSSSTLGFFLLVMFIVFRRRRA